MDLIELAELFFRPDAIPVVLMVGLLVFFSARSLRDPQ